MTVKLQQLYEWRYLDTDTGLVFPYYTKPALDEIKTWDLKDKEVFEYGIGDSTRWWSERSKYVTGVESNKDWFDEISLDCFVRGVDNYLIYCESSEDYVKVITGDFDIIIVDGIHRDECIWEAVNHLKPGGKLIIDNWMQPSVWMPQEKTLEVLKDFNKQVFKQPDHYDWATAILSK